MIRRFLLLAVAAGLALTGLVSVAPSASAAGCNAQNGTIVVVDFSHWGLPQRTQCVLGTADGVSLLQKAGFPPTPASANPSFICRISNGAQSYPTQDQDRCIQASPASAYWSYWVAGPSDPNCLPGGTPHTWTYSGCGASSYTPGGPGEVQLWVFGAYNASNPPGGRSPDSIRALYPAPVGGGASTSSHGAAAGTTEAPRSVEKASPSATISPAAKPSASASTSSPASSSASASAAGGVVAGATDIVKGAATPSKKSSGSGPTGALIALGVVVVLGVGGWFARRRFAGRAAG